MKMFDNTLLAASIVTWHTSLCELESCLYMLEVAGVSIIYVVDNSSDPMVAKLCESRKSVVYLSNPSNIGYGAAHNIALRRSLASNTRYHLVLNSDVKFSPESINILIDYLECHEQVALAHPRILSPDGSDSFTIRRLPTPFDLILRRFLPSRFLIRVREKYLLNSFDHQQELNVPYVQGSFMLLRTGVLREIGLFDERFFLYPEDIDLTRRIHERYPTMFVPSSVVFHSHRAGSYHSRRLLLIHIVNMIRYFNKWGWFIDPSRRKANKNLKLRLDRLSSTNLTTVSS